MRRYFKTIGAVSIVVTLTLAAVAESSAQTSTEAQQLRFLYSTSV